ncbi:MAG: DNA methylase [Pelagibacterales bacterium]|nr:DNA methylase [Pelagibacterales bacterium]
MNYQEFLQNKIKNYQYLGFDIDESELNKNLFDYQKLIVKKALKAGRYAIFAECGLGKTLMQLSWAEEVRKKTNQDILILAPLAVSSQTIEEGKKFGIEVEKLKVDLGCIATKPLYGRIYITNYEQLDNIDCSMFGGVVLDESSILKSFDGKLRNKIIDGFASTSFKLACTATPSPNDPMELGNHAEFLNVMGYNEMLAMYFVHDGGETAKWRLKGHCNQLFWDFVSSWAIMIGNPSDIGFDGSKHILPKLNLIEKKIETEKKENGQLFNDTSISATDFNAELRRTQKERLKEVSEIVNGSDESFIVWIKQNEEGEELRRLIPNAIEVKGGDSAELKEKRLLGFAKGEFRVLITKTKIAQFGMNFQNCRNQVFASLDFSFEGTYQAIRRSYRFGQKHEVNIYLITLDTMANVKTAIETKEDNFRKMQHGMVQALNLNQQKKEKKLMTNFEKKEGDNFTIYNGDCVQVIQQLPDRSVDFSIYSPPFADLYCYSDSIEDMGNSKDYKEFMVAFGFLIKEMARVVKEGRNVAVHCMDLPIQKGKEGFIGLRDFSGLILQAFTDAGFIYHSRVTIWKDPVIEMQRTKALGLLHKQVKKDSSMSRVGIPDYLMIFRNAGENKTPINCKIDVDTWQKFASPVWMDINYSKTLNKNPAREDNDEKHICPLQLDTIYRAITLWSNEGETVFTPFMGIGSEVYQALKMNRKGVGIELKKSYFDVACKNILEAEQESKIETLF